jgi:hypothetical protein
VEYIMTKARLGKESNERERLLTKSLYPVREIMQAGDLDFNQLLQRDLDDHRVATSLIPYLLKPRATGPAFFPPIMAVLLPFEERRPSRFPSIRQEPEPVTAEGMPWQQWQAGDSFQVRRLLDERGNPHSANLAQLLWNYAEAKLVVLDGQHRAMALLAIERTMSGGWQGSEGAKFRSFYEDQVNQYLKEFGISESLDLAQVEVPVTVCWFPDKTGEAEDAHAAARKLFVDVNKEAKVPSESRIILLSDAELLNVLTRSLLSSLRTSNGDNLLPLYAVEYDNPDVKTSQPARWSVMTNIHLLKMVVSRCIFGSPKYLKNVSETFGGGREKKSVRDSFMREQLDISSLFPAEVVDGGTPYRRDEIGNEKFPIGQADTISDQFARTWGAAILNLLSKLAPYAAHARALVRMEKDWSMVVDPFASLARDALFGGVGVFWTLKDSHDHFLEEVRQKKLKTTRSENDDVIRAWRAIEKKKDDFEVWRAEEYLGSAGQEKQAASKEAFGTLNTHACQLGLMLTLGSLWEVRKRECSEWSFNELPAFSEALVVAWNAFFEAEDGRKTRDRRLAFSRSVQYPINQIGHMDTGRAVYFRYFWLQALATPAAWEHVADWFLSQQSLIEQVERARRLYLEFMASEKAKRLKADRPKSEGRAKEEKLQKEAYDWAVKTLRKALTTWFFVDADDFDAWEESSRDIVAATDMVDEDLEIATDEEEAEASEESPANLQEILARASEEE